MPLTVLRDGASTQARARLAAAPGPRRLPWLTTPSAPHSLVSGPQRLKSRHDPSDTDAEGPLCANGPHGVGPRGSEAIVKRLVALHRPGRVRHDLRRAGRPRPGVDHDQAREAAPRPGQPRARHARPAQAHGRHLPGARSRAHSREMVRRGYFSHNSFNGESFSARLIRFGFSTSGCTRWTVGEDIACGYGPGARPRPCSRPGCTARRTAPSSSTRACAESASAVPRAPTRASPASSSPRSTAGPAPSSRGRRAERAGSGRGGRKGRRARFASLVCPMG